MKRKILIVDDEWSILHSLKGILEDEGYAVSISPSGEKALEDVRKDPPELILLDVWMPGMDGLSVLKELKKIQPQIPVIIISGHGNIETAVKATRMGALDFVEKPISFERLLISIQNALELHRLEEENRLWRQKAHQKSRLTGKSPAMESLRTQIRMAAPTNATVLITGENGTGKELVARLLHQNSLRSRRPMIEVNCAAIPEELIESELFGHEKGAFTGALEKKRGKFDTANGGTLFLDEIGDMSLRTQAKVLRIIQEQVFERVGGSSPIRVDTRIVAATNKSLLFEIENGRFRQDLYYRLNVIPIEVPPLRDRQEDIPLLVEDFLNESAMESTMGRKTLDADVLAMLQRYSWPGNVRELKNFVERLIIMTPEQSIGLKDLPRDFLDQTESAKPSQDYFQYPTLREARCAFEKDYLNHKLDTYQRNVSLTANQIGVERSHLYRKMKALGIGDPSGGGSEAENGARERRSPNGP